MTFQKRVIRPASRPVAVFDVDETLIWEKSMFSFLRYYMIAEHGEKIGTARYTAFANTLRTLSKTAPREDVNRAFYKVFAGQDLEKLAATARSWFAQKPASAWFIPEVLAALRVHQQLGHRVVLLSGSAKFILAPIAEHIGADDVLAIELGVSGNGTCTGEIAGRQTIGLGKREAVQALLQEAVIEPIVNSFGYGDHESDAPFLDLCDAGFVVRHEGASTRLDWAQTYHPFLVRAAKTTTSSTAQSESYANV